VIWSVTAVRHHGTIPRVSSTDRKAALNSIALALQAVLLGEITNNIFAIGFSYGEEPRVDVVFYLYDNPSYQELEDLGSAITEASTYWEPQTEDVQTYFVPLSKHRPMKLDKWVFMRKDDSMIERIEPYQIERIDPRSWFGAYSEAEWLGRRSADDLSSSWEDES
jgi:hypothetical protein